MSYVSKLVAKLFTPRSVAPPGPPPAPVTPLPVPPAKRPPKPLKTPLRVGTTNVRTIYSAERMVRLLSVNLRWYGWDNSLAEDWADGIQRCVSQICETTGESVDAVMERLDPLIEKSFRFQQRQSRRLGEYRLLRYAN